MRLTVRQLRRIISEAIMNEGQLIDGPDTGPGVTPMSIGARIVALREKFLDEWEKIPHERGRDPKDYLNAMHEAFKKYAGGKFAIGDPGVKEALEEFIKSWRSGPFGNLDIKDLPAGERRRAANWAQSNADEAYEENAPEEKADANKKAREEAERLRRR